MAAHYLDESFANFGENPALLRALYDVNPTLVFVKDRQGRFVFANKSLAEVYGTTVEDLIGKTDADFNPDITEIEHFLANDIAVMDSHEELFIPEERVTSQDGSVVWLQTNKRPLVDEDGTCNHVLGVSVDITLRVLAEERADELRARLSRSERLESLGVMAGGIAHDLNNILGPVVGYASLIKMAASENAEVVELLDEMSASAARAVAVIQDLLTLARRGVYEAHAVNVNRCIGRFLSSAAIRELRSLRADVELTVSNASDLGLVLGSTSHLHQVLLNTVQNAFDAIVGPGTVRLRTRRETLDESRVVFEEIPAGAYVVIEVEDSGHGISEGDQQRIFEPFFSTKAVDGAGTGLGLSVVYGLVKDMSGYIELDSTPGEGTRIRVWLPASSGLTPEEAPRAAVDLRGQGQILVIDDLASQRRLASRMLTSLGYEVLTAASGPEGVVALHDCDGVELVIIDMLMPTGGDGLETFRAIQQSYPAQRCMIASGYAESARAETALQEGARVFLRKPYTQASLGHAVRQALSD